MVRYLVDSGASINPTVLHRAVYLVKDDIVAFLLEWAADSTIRDGDSNQTPPKTAEVNGRATAADLLRSAPKRRHV
jgi:ankyrin repeat protein